MKLLCQLSANPRAGHTKAFQELVLYYLRERITAKNLEIKYLVATNVNEWFIFEASIFERAFAKNKNVVKQFNDFEEGRLADKSTDFFYKNIAEPAIEEIKKDIEFTYFDLRKYEKPLRNESKADDNKLIALYKLFSPEHLLRLPFSNDSNSLDKGFYAELLHIIGLTETKEGSKKLIARKPAKERDKASLLENAITKIDSLDKLNRVAKPSQFGDTKEERLFNLALELVITWVNRILFLKLLEAQLIAYHKNDKSYSFLNFKKINNYDQLEMLFFQVLAKKVKDRNDEIKQNFANVPYLNSSLFEPTELEQSAILISNLQDELELPVISSTVLKDNNGKKRTGNLSTLEYLFEFLNAYDFSSEGSEEIQEENKSLINASVLGLIFEKINGYKDGSFFTPGFITMYMCRETIRRAVVQKFNDVKKWGCKYSDNLAELYDKIEDRKEANDIINSLKICDPAVGSGHFLVSALNEIIAIKSDLRILQDREGKRLKEYQIEVVNDELIVTDNDGELFEYTHTCKESQRMQEALFHEKQTIIENCLFGVDINPNSVKICRLRLWIELLKNAYYNDKNELETLPNIDINIKCGNSLISRFDLKSNLSDALKKVKINGKKVTIESYKAAVQSYREASSKDEKWEMEKFINDIKSNFRTELSIHDPKMKDFAKKSGQLEALQGRKRLIDTTDKKKTDEKKKIAKLIKEVEKLSSEIEEIKNNRIYENAFEWRFEFPEVLNDKGDFIGFDVCIGNPPYIRQEAFSDDKPYLKDHYKTFAGTADIYVYFYEKSLEIIKENGFTCFITSSKFLEANYGKSLINFILDKSELSFLINFNDLPVFEGLTTYPLIILLKKINHTYDYTFSYFSLDKLPEFQMQNILEKNEHLTCSKNIFISNDFNFIDNKTSKLIEKLKQNSISLKEFCELPIVGIKTGFNEGFITEMPEGEFIKPYIFGRDIKKYSPILNKHRIVFPYNKDFSLANFTKDSEILQFLLKSKSQLSSRAIIKDGIKNKTKCWYEYQQINKSLDYSKEFITYPNVSLGSNFTLSKNAIIDMTAFVVKSDSRYLLAILNSKLIEFLLNLWCIKRRGGYLECKVQYLERIPIRSIPMVDQKPIVLLADKILELKKENPDVDTSALETEIDQLVYQLYGLTEDEIKIVEGA